MARLYADEDVPRSVSARLRELGHDVLTAHEAGQAGRGIPDDRVLAFALADGRAVLTKNRRHFVALHRKAPNHSGIIAFTEDLNYSDLADRIHGAIIAEGSLAGCLIKVNRPPS